MNGYREGLTLAVPGGAVLSFDDAFEFLIKDLPDWISEDGTCWARGLVNGENGLWTLCLPLGLTPARPGVVYGARHDFVGTDLVRSYVLAVQLPSRHGRTSWPALT